MGTTDAHILTSVVTHSEWPRLLVQRVSNNLEFLDMNLLSQIESEALCLACIEEVNSRVWFIRKHRVGNVVRQIFQQVYREYRAQMMQDYFRVLRSMRGTPVL